MASNSELLLRGESSWLSGFTNLWGKENRRWWGTRYWLVQLIIWMLIINGITFFIYKTPIEEMYGPDSGEVSETEQTELQMMQQNPELIGLIPFMRLAGLGMVIGVLVIAQGAIIGEKQSGTAAWVLSKPVSRIAFILSKLAGYGFGIFGVMCVLIGAILYVQIWITTGVQIPPLHFAGMIGLVFLDLLFYLTLSIMLGTIFNSRGALIGIPLILLFIYMLIPNLPVWLVAIMPWNLLDNLSQPAIALSVEQGLPIQSITPLVATVLWCTGFIGVAIWRFHREDF
jgi:ABC-2 type transport system permease protein